MKGQKSPILTMTLLVLFLAIWIFARESEDVYAIKAAKIYTSGSAGVLTDAALLVQNGRIQKIIKGADVPPVPVKDYSGKTIMPGMVDAHSYISAYDRLLENTEVITSDLESHVVFDPTHPEVARALEAGITTVNLVPRSENLVGGMSSILKLGTDFNSFVPLKKRSFLKISFSRGVAHPDRAPTSLMGAEDMLSRKMESIQKNDQAEQDGLFQQNGLRSLLDGDLLPMVVASSFAEINTALQWMERWGLTAVIVGGEEAFHLSRLIREKNVPVLLSPLHPSSPEKWAKNVARLIAQDLTVGFASHMPEAGSLSLRLSALILFHQGIPSHEALKTITAHPARILGVADAVGSIEEGKDADLVIFDGEPLDLRSRVCAVFVNGRPLFEREN